MGWGKKPLLLGYRGAQDQPVEDIGRNISEFQKFPCRGRRAKDGIFILETPLFRVRNKKETTYCYNETEKKRALVKIKTPEITRFKGLGEISPNEFGLFIGKKIRLIPVTLGSRSHVSNTLDFFMGKNTPERKKFIVDNLISNLD